MASEIRVDKINSLSGVGTVTLSPTGVDISGITTVSTLKVGTGVTASSDGDIFFTGIATATTFSGSGANLTALPSAQLSGALPAISAANLTNVPAANVVGVHTSLTVTNATTTGTAVVGGGVTISESGIEASGIGITCANINGGQIGRRNIVINGGMRINQRGTSSHTLNSGNTNAYVVDRFNVKGGEGTIVASRDTDVPSGQGFDNSIKVDCTGTDTSLSANFESYIQYLPESQDLTHLAYGTSGAKTVTFSFWVKSNLAATFGFYMYVTDAARAYQTTFAISSANTWEKKVITIVGDTTGSGFNNDNGVGAEIRLYLAGGSNISGSSNQNAWGTNVGSRIPSGTNILSSTDNNFYFTGFQMEVGSQATPFEHRNFDEEFSLCQRYFQILKTASAVGSGTNLSFIGSLSRPMRATPTLSKTSGNFNFGDMVSVADQSSNSPTIDGGYLNQDIQVTGYISGFDNLTNYRPYRHEPTDSHPALITASAEF